VLFQASTGNWRKLIMSLIYIRVIPAMSFIKTKVAKHPYFLVKYSQDGAGTLSPYCRHAFTYSREHFQLIVDVASSLQICLFNLPSLFSSFQLLIPTCPADTVLSNPGMIGACWSLSSRGPAATEYPLFSSLIFFGVCPFVFVL